MKINYYCYERKGLWYFRKRIPLKINSKNKAIRISLKKLLGNKGYYNSLLDSSLFLIVNYLNNNLELKFLRGDKLSMEDINNFIKELLLRYKSKAIIKDNDYINNFGSEVEEIENMRFNSLTYQNENNQKVLGHTLEALEREYNMLLEAYETEDEHLIKKKANDIMDRQNIISKDEFKKIPIETKFNFEKALVKLEIEVILRDMKNFKKHTKVEKDNKLEKSLYHVLNRFNNNPEVIKYFEQSNVHLDNWDILIDKFRVSKLTKGQNFRSESIVLKQFREIMDGDRDTIPLRHINKCNLDDINELKNIFKNLPKLDTKELRELNDKYGTLNTIRYLKETKPDYKKLVLTGLNSKIKIIIQFLNEIKLYYPDIYGNLNIDIWRRLSINKNELSAEEKNYNKNNEKTYLDSKDLNKFLLTRYSSEYEPIAGQAKRNFTRHTSASPHIFWSFILAIFTGARSEELAQIKMNDLKKINVNQQTIYYFDIKVSDYSNQSEKNKQTERIIPISKYLIDLGFLNYVQDRFNNKEEYLFTLSLNKDNKRVEFRKSFNIDFKKFFYKEKGDDYKLKVPTFHDLRAHFISKYTKGDANTLKLNNLKKLIGHTPDEIAKDTTLKYYDREPMSIEDKKNLVDNIDFQIAEGYEYIKNLMIEKYNNNILKDLNI